MKIRTLILFTYFLICLPPSYSQEAWEELITGTTSRLNSVSSLRNTSTWVCGENAVIIRSLNSGDTWTNANESQIPSHINLVNIMGIDQNISFVTGYSATNTYIFKTTDGGLNWQTVYSSSVGRINGIHMLDNQKGTAIGNPVNGFWVILRTTNAGSNWYPVSSPLPQTNSESGFQNSLWGSGQRIWFGTNNFRIYYTLDLGSSWNTLLTSPEQNTKSIWFDYNYNIGFSGSSGLIRTTNTGVSWNGITVPGTGEIKGVTGSGMSRLTWLVRNDNKIYYSSNYGLNWRLSYTSQSGIYRSISIERNGFFGGAVFALKDNGGITRTFFLVNGIEQISNEIPASFYLEQNFPNPFNPLTKIRFGLPEAGITVLKVFNSTGQEIETLLNGYLSPAVYEAAFDASEYSSGVYYYRINTSKFTQTRKMIVVK